MALLWSLRAVGFQLSHQSELDETHPRLDAYGFLKHLRDGCGVGVVVVVADGANAAFSPCMELGLRLQVQGEASTASWKGSERR